MATVKGAVVGQLLLSYEWDERGNYTVCWLRRLYVRTSHRKRGVATELVRYVMAAERLPYYRLNVDYGNQASRRLFEGLRARFFADNARLDGPT